MKKRLTAVNSVPALALVFAFGGCSADVGGDDMATTMTPGTMTAPPATMTAPPATAPATMPPATMTAPPATAMPATCTTTVPTAVGAGPAPSLETVEFVINAAGCAGADCHGGEEFNPLDLRVNEELYTNLTQTYSEECNGLPMVDPCNPEGSALVILLKGPCGQTARMPMGCFETEDENNCVPDEYIAAIEQWIANGAPAQ